MHFKGRNVVVLGLGLTGLSLARWLTRHGAQRARRRHARGAAERRRRWRPSCRKLRLETGPFSASTFAGADMIAISPGVAKDQPAIREAVAAGVELVGDVELFARALPGGQKVLAITGTNGKTTVTALAGELARAAGMSTVVAGNIGNAVLDVLAEYEDGAAWPDLFVLELSSYQLETTTSLQAGGRDGAQRLARTISTATRASRTMRPRKARSSRTRRCRCSIATTRSCA